MASHELEELLSTIGKSIRDTLKAVEEHSLTRYLEYFDSEEGSDGKLKLQPKTVTIPVPAADGTYEPREIPIVALMHHSSLQIEELRLKFHVHMDDEDDREGKARVHARLVPLGVRSSHPGAEHAEEHSSFADVEVFFKRGEPNEGVARISGSYYKIL